MWDQITYPYQNFDDQTFEVWTWISNFIPHCSGHRLSMLGLKFTSATVKHNVIAEVVILGLLQVGALLQGHSQEYHECTGPRFNLKTVSAGKEISYSDKIFLILKRYVDIYPNIWPIFMGFLYFYLSTGHFEITVVTNSSDLRNYPIKKTRPAWFYCMTTKHTSCELTHEITS